MAAEKIPSMQVALVKLLKTHGPWQIGEVASFALPTARDMIARGIAAAATQLDYLTAVAEADARVKHDAIDTAELVLLDASLHPVVPRAPEPPRAAVPQGGGKRG